MLSNLEARPNIKKARVHLQTEVNQSHAKMLHRVHRSLNSFGVTKSNSKLESHAKSGSSPFYMYEQHQKTKSLRHLHRNTNAGDSFQDVDSYRSTQSKLSTNRKKSATNYDVV